MSDSPTSSSSSAPATFGQMLFGHVVLLVGFVFLPAFITAVAPLSILKLERQGERVDAKVSKHLLFIIPYRTDIITDVHSIGDRVVAGETTRSRTPTGSYKTVDTEDSAFLTVEGANGSAKVEISPINIKSFTEKVAGFLSRSDQATIRLVAIANWKFGVFAGGLLSLLTVFYVWLQISSLWRTIKKFISK